jgi:hypothetical protein
MTKTRYDLSIKRMLILRSWRKNLGLHGKPYQQDLKI